MLGFRIATATMSSAFLGSSQQFLLARMSSSSSSSTWIVVGGGEWALPGRRGMQVRCLNTFLPYPEFGRSVECLDNRRLGKQRVEAWQILRIVQASPVPVKGTAWANSPAVRMWRGFPDALLLYYNACLDEWHRRGFKNVLLQPLEPESLPVTMPPWLGDEAVHASHRSNLLRKEPEHYTQFGWTETPELPYVWPVPMVKVEATTAVKKKEKTMTTTSSSSRKKKTTKMSESVSDTVAVRQVIVPVVTVTDDDEQVRDSVA